MRLRLVAPGVTASRVGLERYLRVLTGALETLAAAAAAELVTNREIPLLYESGCRYQREARDRSGARLEEWRSPLAVCEAGAGDCEDLAAYRVAELRERLGEPSARFDVLSQEPRPGREHWLFHIRIRRQDGRLEDPSRLLGMTPE